VKEDLELGALKRAKIYNVETNPFRRNRETKNSIRKLNHVKILRNATNRRLQD